LISAKGIILPCLSIRISEQNPSLSDWCSWLLNHAKRMLICSLFMCSSP